MLNLKEKIIYLDGATGTNLQKAGMPTGVCPELWILEHPQVLIDLQRAYVEAGTQILYAPTFSGNAIKLEEYGIRHRLQEINERLVALSREAAGDNCLVAGNLTMTGRALEPMGDMDFEELVDCYKEQVAAIAKAGVDLFVIETMMSIQECRAAVLAVKETTDLPVFVTITLEGNGRTLYGTDPVTALITMQSLGVDAFGINCSCGPDTLIPIMKKMSEYAEIPLIAKPNAGLPQLIDGKTVFDMEPEVFAVHMEALTEAGATILGGCCGTSPEYIKAVKQHMDAVCVSKKDNEKLVDESKKSCELSADKSKEDGVSSVVIRSGNENKKRRMLTSERAYVEITLDGAFRIVGERINPTGKKKLQAELREGSLELVTEMALEQTNQGAAVLDINVGMGGIDEQTMMLQVLEEVGQQVDTPLCIDSSSIDVVATALRRYPGRALVNSISCEKEKIEKLLPIVKKYGAMFILLPMQETGLPKNQQERWENIQYVLEKAYALGFTKEDIVVDGLVAAVAAEPTAAIDTLATIERCYQEGLATICGLSNISFGLPDRSYVNSAFLAMAINKGLTMAIANPSQELFKRSCFASDLLLGKEDAAVRYVEYCNSVPKPVSVVSEQNQLMQQSLETTGKNKVKQNEQRENSASQSIEIAVSQNIKQGENKNSQGQEIQSLDKVKNDNESLNSWGKENASIDNQQGDSQQDILTETIRQDVLKGKEKQIASHIDHLLAEAQDKIETAEYILNQILIPAINEVGELFNQQKYFLPQLIISARAMENGVAVLEPILQEKNKGAVGATVVFATVKGDVHDIGKNLVTMMMKNYGFHVIDLGKDVDKETILQAAKEHQAEVIGLSALMTTTMSYMKEVIEAVQEEGLNCKILVGGAAVTEDYAKEIGADGYAQDAVEAVELVKGLLG